MIFSNPKRRLTLTVTSITAIANEAGERMLIFFDQFWFQWGSHLKSKFSVLVVSKIRDEHIKNILVFLNPEFLKLLTMFQK